jgi:hypothetical protein
MTSVLVFFIIFVLFPAIILGFILTSRYLRYKETQTMIEHGITPPPPQPIIAMPPPQAPPVQQMPYAAPMPPMRAGGMPAPMRPMPPQAPPMAPRPSRSQLTWGLVLTGVGIGLTLALWPIGWIANSAAGESGVHFPLGLGPWMLAGFIPLFVGLALILAHIISQPERNVQSAHHMAPPPFVNSGYGAPPVAPPPPPAAAMPPAVTAIPDAPPPDLPLFEDIPPVPDETRRPE